MLLDYSLAAYTRKNSLYGEPNVVKRSAFRDIPKAHKGNIP